MLVLVLLLMVLLLMVAWGGADACVSLKTMNSGCSTTPPSRSVLATTDESGPRLSGRSGGRMMVCRAEHAVR